MSNSNDKGSGSTAKAKARAKADAQSRQEFALQGAATQTMRTDGGPQVAPPQDASGAPTPASQSAQPATSPQGPEPQDTSNGATDDTQPQAAGDAQAPNSPAAPSGDGAPPPAAAGAADATAAQAPAPDAAAAQPPAAGADAQAAQPPASATPDAAAAQPSVAGADAQPAQPAGSPSGDAAAAPAPTADSAPPAEQPTDTSGVEATATDSAQAEEGAQAAQPASPAPDQPAPALDPGAVTLTAKMREHLAKRGHLIDDLLARLNQPGLIAAAGPPIGGAGAKAAAMASRLKEKRSIFGATGRLFRDTRLTERASEISQFLTWLHVWGTQAREENELMVRDLNDYESGKPSPTEALAVVFNTAPTDDIAPLIRQEIRRRDDLRKPLIDEIEAVEPALLENRGDTRKRGLWQATSTLWTANFAAGAMAGVFAGQSGALPLGTTPAGAPMLGARPGVFQPISYGTPAVDGGAPVSSAMVGGGPHILYRPLTGPVLSRGVAEQAFKPPAANRTFTMTASPQLGQITVVSPPVQVASVEAAKGGSAVAMDVQQIAQGAGQLSPSGVAALAQALPPGSYAVYPALKPEELGPSAANVQLTPAAAGALVEQGYGVTPTAVIEQSVNQAAGAEPPPASAEPMQATIVPGDKPAGDQTTGVLGAEKPGDPVGNLDQAGGGQAKHGVLDFLGLPVRLAPNLSGRSELTEQLQARQELQAKPGQTIRPNRFQPLMKMLSVQGVNAEPDVRKWRKAAPSFGIQDASPAGLLTPDVRLKRLTAGGSIPPVTSMPSSVSPAIAAMQTGLGQGDGTAPEAPAVSPTPTTDVPSAPSLDLATGGTPAGEAPAAPQGAPEPAPAPAAEPAPTPTLPLGRPPMHGAMPHGRPMPAFGAIPSPPAAHGLGTVGAPPMGLHTFQGHRPPPFQQHLGLAHEGEPGSHLPGLAHALAPYVAMDLAPPVAPAPAPAMTQTLMLGSPPARPSVPTISSAPMPAPSMPLRRPTPVGARGPAVTLQRARSGQPGESKGMHEQEHQEDHPQSQEASDKDKTTEVNLLATQVWNILRRRIQSDSQRMGKY